MCETCLVGEKGTGCKGADSCLRRQARRSVPATEAIRLNNVTVMKAKPDHGTGEVVLEMKPAEAAMLAAASAPKPSPFRIKDILVPIDFSDCSKKALQYAIPLAQEHKATLTLLHVVPPIYTMGEFGGIEYPQLQAEMQENGHKALAKLNEEEVRGVVPTEALVRLGAPANEIVETARSLQSDLIVVSTHGRTGIKHLLLGSVAEHVVRRAPCPVMIVREREHEFVTT